ncbi:DnaJ-domain-containing protein [Thozetella sp. PMI_491]|nr:DnaJ-domain-containing protein [Thozetella sp. PMI_491]
MDAAYNQDYYAILGLARTATQAEIRGAYKRLAKLKHPDKNPQDSQATASFQLLHEAYTTLSDRDGRKVYDLDRDEWSQEVPYQTSTSPSSDEQVKLDPADIDNLLGYLRRHSEELKAELFLLIGRRSWVLSTMDIIREQALAARSKEAKREVMRRVLEIFQSRDKVEEKRECARELEYHRIDSFKRLAAEFETIEPRAKQVMVRLAEVQNWVEELLAERCEEEKRLAAALEPVPRSV